MQTARWLPLAMAIFGSGCSPPFGLDERLALDVARERWDARSFRDYVFETQHSCFCPLEGVGPVRITVRQDTIESVVLLETGGAVDPRFWYTIDQLFDMIPAFADHEEVEDVDVEYDGTLWYPTSVTVGFPDDVLDAGSHYTITSVGPAP